MYKPNRVMTFARTRLLIVVIVGGTVSPLLAQTPEAEVKAFLQKRDLEIKEAVGELSPDATAETRDAVAELINARIDFSEMGRLALGDHFAELSDEEQQRFVATFAAIVRSQALGDLSVYQAEVTYNSIDVTEDRARAQTSALMEDVTLPVDYLLHRKDDLWWVYDIVIDGVSTIDGYSVSFRSYIRRRGFDAFMASLDRRLARDTAK